MLSPASLTLKFDAILDVPEGDEALSDTTLPLLFRPLSPRPAAEPIGFPVSYSYDPAPVVEEIVVESPSSGASTLIASPGTTGHAEIPPTVPPLMSPPPDLPEAIVVDTATTPPQERKHTICVCPACTVRTVKQQPCYRALVCATNQQILQPATPRRVSHGSVLSYRPERDERGKLKLSTRIRRLFGLGPKREEQNVGEPNMSIRPRVQGAALPPEWPILHNHRSYPKFKPTWKLNPNIAVIPSPYVIHEAPAPRAV
ncbi:hypothetical protein RHS01_01100 [Rhizoctonia solani]|uniref:Uncharacterized protein n=1 Tax=Rhizoctonia solani TaxID=456999 RepID=A0A8H7IJ72_9AGAM|nr:hypothetical protein RHS01_01100 [Rhizoctonia solani]